MLWFVITIYRLVRKKRKKRKCCSGNNNDEWKRWSCRYFLNLEKQKTNLFLFLETSVWTFGKLKKRKKDSSFGFHFLRKKLCAMKEDRRRRFTFSIVIHRRFQKQKFLLLCCGCACAVSKRGPETFSHNLINPRAGTSKALYSLVFYLILSFR